MVARISDLFLPLFEDSKGAAGFVTIQGDPFGETAAQNIIDEGVKNRKIGENIVVKIPVNPARHRSDQLLRRQRRADYGDRSHGDCRRLSPSARRTARRPKLRVTRPHSMSPHITGILDDHFKRVVAAGNIDISAEAMKYAGLSIAKREYAPHGGTAAIPGS